jgi:hypothetical protein
VLFSADKKEVVVGAEVLRVTGQPLLLLLLLLLLRADYALTS